MKKKDLNDLIVKIGRLTAGNKTSFNVVFMSRSLSVYMARGISDSQASSQDFDVDLVTFNFDMTLTITKRKLGI